MIKLIIKMRQLKELMPDFFIKDKGKYIAPKVKVLETIHDGDYYYNSCRIPWRYSICTFYENTLKLLAMIVATGNWYRKLF
ncbi:MAG TPA: hypothetical protein VIK26_03880 [Clostridium sp.]